MTALISSRQAKLALLALLPLIILLILSSLIWGGCEQSYVFWKHWGLRNSEVTSVAEVITTWGNPLAYVVYGGILFNAVRTCDREAMRLVLCYVVVQVVVAVVLTHLFKNIFGQPRPYTGESVPNPWSFKSMYQSFPSGHTSEIIGAVLPLAIWRERIPDALVCGLWLTLVAYSRVYLGYHYIKDIWGGMALGCLAAFCIVYFARSGRKPYERNVLS